MQKYTCKTCGAELYWNTDEGALKCEYCGNIFKPADFNDVDISDDQKAEKSDKYDKATDNSDSLDLVVYKCTECRAEIITARGTVATTCAYCNRAITLTNNITGNFKPDSLIPFSIGKKEAKAIYHDYVKKSFLVPNEFKDEENLKQMKGIYVPFWLHTFSSNASAKLECEDIEKRRRGDDLIIIHHKYDVRMKAKGIFTKIPTDALKNLDNELMNSVEPFDYDNLKTFNPAYMAGFYAEKYNETSRDAFPRAHNRAISVMRSNIFGESCYDSTEIVSFKESVNNYNAEYSMLPVWIFNANYKNKKYTFAINGDTGKISGSLPVSIQKVLAVFAGSFLGTQLIALLLRILEVL